MFVMGFAIIGVLSGLGAITTAISSSRHGFETVSRHKMVLFYEYIIKLI